MRNVLVLFVALGLLIPTAGSVEAQKPKKKRKSQAYEYVEKRQARPARRSTTEAADGTCLRDTGRPMDSLRLNHRCDREEFWARFNDYGDNHR